MFLLDFFFWVVFWYRKKRKKITAQPAKQVIERVPSCWFSYFQKSGGKSMTVYEALSLMIGFAILFIDILSFKRK